MSQALAAPAPELTPELADKLLQAAKSGLFLATAAEAVGIAPDLLETWLRMGLSPGALEPYRTFARAYRAQEQGVQLEAVASWRQATLHDWKAAAAWLAARYPEQWGPKATRARQSGDFQPTTADAAAEREMVRQLVASRPPELDAILRELGWVAPVENPATPKG